MSELSNPSQDQNLAQARATLRRAESIRVQTLAMCNAYRAGIEEQLQVYRSQRAWKVMLWFRKAYSLLTTSPFLGKLRLLRFVIASAFGRARFDDQELTFPELATYLPHALRTPFSGKHAPSPDTGSQAELTAFPAPQRIDIIILPVVEFEFRFQRPQQLAVALSRAGHRVLWVSPGRNLPLNSARPYEVVPLAENLWEARLRAPEFNIYGDDLSPDAAEVLLQAVDALCADCGLVEACVLLQLPFWRAVGAGLRERWSATLLYDCMDDWDGFPQISRFNLAEEARLAEECDVLVVTASKLAEKFQHRRDDAVLIHNAADFELFSTSTEASIELAGIRHPIIGYFGAIADWVDLGLVVQIARMRPHYAFVLAGAAYDQDLTELRQLPNVHLLGHLEYREMPRLLAGFDVAIIPFKVNPVTDATDPVKLYEYFSQGKPVVATPLPELQRLNDLLYLASGADEFAHGLDQAVAESDASLKSRRIQFASENTWEHRRADLLAAVRAAHSLVSVLIVTYNSAGYLRLCLYAVFERTTYPNFEVIVVDNASTDETCRIVERFSAAGRPLRLFRLPENRGFAAANNFAASQAHGEYLVLLNPDTVVTAGWIGRLKAHFQADPQVGLAGPMTNFAGNELKVNADYEDREGMERFAERMHRECRDEDFDIQAVPLFCGMISRAAWEAAGPLDERFEVGMFEDDDFSIRVRNAGFRVIGVQDCFVHHFGQGSFGQLSGARFLEIFHLNRTRFEEKWQRSWVQHCVRPGVRTPANDRVFHPSSFDRPAPEERAARAGD